MGWRARVNPKSRIPAPRGWADESPPRAPSLSLAKGVSTPRDNPGSNGRNRSTSRPRVSEVDSSPPRGSPTAGRHLSVTRASHPARSNRHSVGSCFGSRRPRTCSLSRRPSPIPPKSSRSRSMRPNQHRNRIIITTNTTIIIITTPG
eukprot:5011877-Alexandrium_andersonii.AAC.1